MIELLKQLNYFPPNVKEYSGGGLEIVFDELQSNYRMLINGDEWTSYNTKTYSQVYEVYSHHYFAKGHCICTGLGLGVRESWILKKKEVTKVTVLEKNEEVIEYHKINNPNLYNNIEIINADVSEYKGKCDTLLLDHYEQETVNEIFEDASQVSKNIDCNEMWIWTLEDFVTLYQRYLNRQNNMSAFGENVIDFGNLKESKELSSASTSGIWMAEDKNPSPFRSSTIDKVDVYNYLKETFNLDKLPEVTEDLLHLFYFMFNSQEVSNYEFLSIYDKNNDRLLIGEAHR